MRRLVASFLLVLSLAIPAAAQTPVPSYRFEPLPKTSAELSSRFTPAQIDILEMTSSTRAASRSTCSICRAIRPAMPACGCCCAMRSGSTDGASSGASTTPGEW
jgi:hypothetical protein